MADPRPKRAAQPSARSGTPARAGARRDDDRDDAEARTPRRRRRPSMRAAFFLVLLVGLLFGFVYPTRTFLDQRADTNRAREQLSVLQAENARLARESKRLSNDSEIERLARAKYGLVKPGERPFVIIPAPTTTPPATGTSRPAP